MSDVAILGAAGRTGTAFVGAITARNVAVRALVHRDDQRTGALTAGASEALTCELGNRAGLEAVIAGVRTVVLIPPGMSPHEAVFAQTACDAARGVGVERFVLHSVLHPYAPAMPHHMRKAASEVIVRTSGMRWTILQPAMYAQTPIGFIRSRRDGRVEVPFSLRSRFNVIDLADVARVAAQVVSEEGHDYATYELAGTAPLSMAQMIEHASAIVSEPLTGAQVLPWQLTLPTRVMRGMASFVAMCDDYDAHGMLGNGRICEWLLGREPTSFPDVARRELAGSGA